MRHLVIAWLTALLACSCGGGSPPEAAMPAHGQEAGARRSALAVRTPDVSALFDWAELTYPQYFPGHSSNALLAPYIYRWYPDSGNYLGLAGDTVAVLGPISGGVILNVGTVSDFACKVYPGDCSAPVIASQPRRGVVTLPTAARFEVAAGGSPAPSYQWQHSLDGGATYSDIGGATGSDFTTPPTTLADDGTWFRVVVSNGAGSVASAAALLTVTPQSTILTGIRDIRAFIDKCPTADPAAAIIREDFQILDNGQPFTGDIACTEPYPAHPAARMTEELLTLQTLRLAYAMSIGTEGRLPWTRLSLYDWMKSQIAGVNIVDVQGNSNCCAVLNGRKYMTVSRKPASTLDHYRDWPMLAGWLALVLHETRHAAGHAHVNGCARWPLPTDPLGCDPAYDETNLGAYGIQRWLYSRWATGELNVGLACGTSPSDASRYAQQMASSANDYRSLFVTGAPPDIAAAPPYGGVCYAP